ncbi:tyrosine-type recombinase/integrase [bacterium]|nr:tyrosine-type recombinase/integrase [bacterium]
MIDYHISIYLDTRRAKKNGTYPIKLRVFSYALSKQMLYSTGISLLETQFENVTKAKRVKEELREAKLTLDALQVKANEIASELKPFTFEVFERRMTMSKGHLEDIIYQIRTHIADLKDNDQHSTASTFEGCLNMLNRFLKHLGKPTGRLQYHQVDVKFLKGFEHYVTEYRGNSIATLSIYLRALRKIFNQAIQRGDISQDLYPFGRGRYVIPAAAKVKKALSKADLSILYKATPRNKDQEKARDFWFLSFSLFGMNMKDIVELRWKNINNNYVEFIRRKTRNTQRSNLRPIQVPLSDLSKSIIKKYSNSEKTPSALLFDIIGESDTEEDKYKKVKRFTRYINQHLKELAREVGVTTEVSTNWARHSFATKAIREGASMEFVGEALGHNNPTTTVQYFSGFEDETKQNFMQGLLSFINE